MKGSTTDKKVCNQEYSLQRMYMDTLRSNYISTVKYWRSSHRSLSDSFLISIDIKYKVSPCSDKLSRQ